MKRMFGKNVLVTGGAGAIGSNLVNRLIELGANVVVVDDLSSGYLFQVNEKASFIQHDITEGLLEILPHNIEYIFHCAGFFANQNSVDHPQRDLLVNGMGIINVLEFARLCPTLAKVVYLSSSCVYGPRSGELSTEDPIDLFDTPYGITKFIGEKYANFYKKQYGIDTITFRIFNSYGPGEVPGKYRNVIPNFFRKAMNAEVLTVTGTGEETRDFTFVGDIVEGLIKGALYSGQYSLFNLGTGRQTRIIDLAIKINEIVGNKTPISFMPRRQWDCISMRKANVDNTTQEIGFSAETMLDEGLLAVYNWLQKIENRG